MLVKIFSNKGGGSAGASLNYLLDKPDGTMQVLEGNPTLSRKIAESLKFSTPYTVGALSFEERNLDDSQKREIMAKFERAIFAGLDKEQYNISWIEHTDKGRLELNFFIPNVELTTGKRLQPYYDRADRPLVENFKQVINHEYGLSDPNAPEKRQLMISRQDLPKDKQGALNAIQDGLISLAKQGRINDRQDIINALESSGFEIARVTDKSISIKTEGQNLRLKGAFYEKDFRIGDSLSETIRDRAEHYQRTSEERYHTARDKLERAVEYRERQFQEKYPNRTAELDRAYEKTIQATIHNRGDFALDIRGRTGADYMESRTAVQRNEAMESISRTMENPKQWNEVTEMLNEQGRTGSETLHSDRSELQGHNVGSGERRDTENSENGRLSEENQQQREIIEQVGEQTNGNTNRNSFTENIAELVRTAIERTGEFIGKIREIGERIFGDNSREQLDPSAVQRNQLTVDELKHRTQEVEQQVKEQQAIKSKDYELTL
jgi:mobilization protein A